MVPAPAVIPVQPLLHLSPNPVANDALVFSRVGRAIVPHSSGVNRVRQQIVKTGPRERCIPGTPSLAGGERFQAPSALLNLR